MTGPIEMQQDSIDLDEEEELESLKKVQDSRAVKFGGETNDQEEQFPTPPPLTGLAPTRLEEILTKTKTSEGRWYGMIDPSDNRVVIQGIQRCEALEDQHDYTKLKEFGNARDRKSFRISLQLRYNWVEPNFETSVATDDYVVIAGRFENSCDHSVYAFRIVKFWKSNFL